MHTTTSDILKKRKSCQVFVWGCNENSQLGLGPITDNQFEPVVNDSFKKKKAIYLASGAHHSAVMTKGGELYTWGKGDDGQLGIPDSKRGFIPQRILSLKKKKVLMINCGERFNIAITNDKTGCVCTWGNGVDGQLGTETESPTVFNPVTLNFFARKKVISVSAGLSHCGCVVLNPGGDTEVYTWGSGEKGKLGNNSERSEKAPFLVEAMRGARANVICCGSDFTVVLTARGDVYTWGSGDSGRTGTGSMDNVFVPVYLPCFNQVEIVEIAVGPDHAAAVSADGKLYTWGYGSNGRLGHGEETDILVPTVVDALVDEKVIHASCGGHHTAATTEHGLVYTWGWNHYGQLGLGPPGYGSDSKMVPTIVEALKSHFVVQVSCGEQHTIALVQ